MRTLKKVVLPVAGLGTRFLPATKASPKEMLPVVDKPIIQYAAEEAIAAGMDELIFVTGRHKRSIEDHFDKAYELETELEAKGKKKLLDKVRNFLPEGVACIYTRQPEALGLGHAVLCARAVVDDAPFAVMLADDLIRATPTVLEQMVEIYRRYKCSIIGVQRVPREETASYGIVDPEPMQRGLYRVKGMVEKPSPDAAPSDLAVVGRYILTPRIFDLLEKVPRGAGGEIQLTDAIAALLAEEQVIAYEFVGKRFDCGSKMGYLQATVEYALEHPELNEKFRSYIRSLKL
ncbi:UTP-glucose-1-phosphate uridylyltransferase [Sulfurifustis variabilis]|uniref:UTP--glucose-1-phosphate uridylyltransferase n=1 Tax=Sulfurifustis variabilis TaxID=1675686 RepID=A0A1B4V504_9GAMM|nr:UTP--glucose-1-phosphate uridylyltransferase GalU [Sulfurifustis variabilis]BAU48590.1 UTP-glucose-1-phosphate uridylyltransferase [Sulfurifustis variabilis]